MNAKCRCANWPLLYRRKQFFIILIVCMIVYCFFNERVIVESPKWIKKYLDQAGIHFSKNRAENVALLDFLRQQDAHYIEIGASDAVLALAVAMKGRNAVILPRDHASARRITQATLDTGLTRLVRVLPLTQTLRPKRDWVWRRLISMVTFDKAVLVMNLCNATDELQYQVALPLFLEALKVKAIMINWRLRSTRDIFFFPKFGYRPFFSLDSLQILPLSRPDNLPDTTVWKKENMNQSGVDPNVFLLQSEEGRNQTFHVSSLILPVYIHRGLSGVKTNITIFVYGLTDLVSYFISHGGWENEIIFPLLLFLKNYSDIHLLDFGAYVGLYTLHAANIGRRVVAVDANRNNLLRLAHSVSTNGFEDRVTLVHNALDRSYGDHFVVVQKRNIGASKVVRNGTKASAVKAILADDLLPLITFKRAVLKVDIEGFESQMLAGASKLFSSVDIVLVLMEWLIRHQSTASRLAISNFMQARGYAPYASIESDTVLTGNNTQWPGDIVWKRRSAPTTATPSNGTPTVRRSKRRLHVYDQSPVSQRFDRLTLRTPAGPVVIFTYSPTDMISRSIMQGGTWEAGLNAAIAVVLREDKELQVIDLGANLGVYTLIAAKLGRRAVAVDANLNNVMRLRKSVLANSFQHLVKIVWNAIDSSYKTLRMVIPPSNIGGSWVVSPTDPRSTKGTDVQTVTIDDILEIITFKKAILKYDIEGMEYAGLHNASKLFARIDIPYVFMEWGVIQRDYKISGGRKIPDFIIKFFESRGYKAFSGIRDAGKLGADFNKWPWDIVWHKAKSNSTASTPKNKGKGRT